MDYSPPDADRVLVLAPHPDDEALGCGGTIALYSSQGVETRLLVISDGEKLSNEYHENIDIVDIRRKETTEVSEILGLKKVDFLSFPDGGINSYKNELKLEIGKIVEEFRPDIIFAPSPLDFHQDHIATSEVALYLKNKFSWTKLAFYEVYNTIRFNTLVDITKVMHIKEKAILTYKYSLFLCPELFYDSIKGLNFFRSFYTRKEGFYEAFWILSENIDRESMIRWLSFDQWKLDSSELLFANLKGIDEILYRLQSMYSSLDEKNKEIEKLLNQLEDKEEKIKELETYIGNINNSLFWIVAKKYYEIRNRLLPENTKRRSLYDTVIKALKKKR